MRNWCMRHPVWFMTLYALFYLTCFGFLEKAILVPDLWVHCRLDDLIPFCKYAVVPYVMWFPWIPFTLFYILWHAPRADFWRLCLPLFAGMTLSLLFYVYYIYFYISSVVTGIQFSGFPLEFYVNVVLYVASLVLSIACVFMRQTAEE